MRSLFHGFDAARASRGYLFSSVTCAVLLTALALMQWLRTPRPSERWSLQVVASSPSSTMAGPLNTNASARRAFFGSEKVGWARQQLAQADNGGPLETGAALHRCLSLVNESREADQLAVRLRYRGRSKHGGALLQILAEQYAQEYVHEPRTRSAALVQFAKAAWEATQKRYAKALQEFQQSAHAVRRVQEDIRQTNTEIADFAHQREHQSSQPTEADVTDEVSQQQVTALEQQLAGLRAQRDRLLEQYTDRHPAVQELEGRISDASTALGKLQARRETPPVAAPDGSNDGREPVAAARARLEQQLAELTEEFNSLNAARDKQMANLATLQEDLEQRANELKKAGATFKRLDGGDVWVAEARRSPAAPRSADAVGLLFSIALACLAGCVAATRMNGEDTRLRNASQVESVLSLPVVGLLPRSEDPLSPASTRQPPIARSLQRTAEVTLALFLVSVFIAAAIIDGFSTRLVSHPLSAIADSVREVMHVL